MSHESHNRRRRMPRRSRTQLVQDADGGVQRAERTPFSRQIAAAAARPVSLAVLAALIAAAAIGLAIAAAVIIYAAFVLLVVLSARTRTFGSTSPRARESVMDLPPTLRTRVINVLRMVERVDEDLERLASPPEGVREALDELTASLIETARQAARVDDYLGTIRRPQLETDSFRASERARDEPAQQPIADALCEQLRLVDDLHLRRQSLDIQMEQIGANLGVLHARIVQAHVVSGADLSVEDELTLLRDKTRAMALGMQEIAEIPSA